MKFVLDCSVTMAWCFEDEGNTYTEKILDFLQKKNEARVPPIWKLEVINVLLLAEKKKRIDRLIAANFKNALLHLPIHIDHTATDRVFETVFEIAKECDLSSYDASYLELAFREKIPIATQDEALIKAASKVHVKYIMLHDL